MPKEDTIIRPATKADMAAVGRLGAMLVRAFHQFDVQRFIAPSDATPEDYGEFPWQPIEEERRQRHGRRARRPGHRLHVRGRRGLRLDVAARPAGVLHDIVVDPEHRKGGVGSMLLDAAVAWLREQGAPRIVLDTAWQNEPAQAFFAKAGFRRTMLEMTRER